MCSLWLSVPADRGPFLSQGALQVCTQRPGASAQASVAAAQSWPLTVKGHVSLLAGTGHFPKDFAFPLKTPVLGKEETKGELASVDRAAKSGVGALSVLS